MAAATALDGHSVTGEEAHIVAREKGGPRGGVVDLPDVDSYDNLILLCSSDHKMIDDQILTFPRERLHEIKDAHERWVLSALEPTLGAALPPPDLPVLPLRLVNREQELIALNEALERAEDAPGPSVVVLTGMHGVGKSALGAHWVLHHWARFPGGQLVGDFSRRRHRGAVDIGEILGDFIRGMGGPDVELPAALADRRRMFQRLTAEKRLLMFLDDVEHPAQVTNVLPGGSGSLVVVTSNYHLEELLYEGAQLVVVDPLDSEVSLRLLVEMIGAARIEADPGAVDQLLEICAGLPLALRVSGGRLAGRDRARSVSSFVNGVAQAARPLKVLSGTGNYSIEAIFDFAYADLPAGTRLVYRRIGLHPGVDFLPAAIAVLADISLAEASVELDLLRDGNLIEVSRGSGHRFRLHGLVRHHSRTCVGREDSEVDRVLALSRLTDWYCAALQAADRAVGKDRLRLSDVVVAPSLPTFNSPREAFDWFDAERETVAALIHIALDMEWDERAWQLPEALWPFCYNHKLYSLWTDAYEAGAHAASRLGNRAAEARMRSGLARAYSDQSDFERAASEMRAAKAAADRAGHDMLKASVAEFGAIMLYERGDIAGALSGFRKSRRMFEKAGGMRGVAIQDYQLAKCLIAMGAFGRSLKPLTQAHSVFVSLGDEVITTRVLRRRGEALLGLARLSESRAALDAAIEITERLNLRFDQAQALEVLAAVVDAESEPQVARTYWEHAYVIYRELGHPRAESLFMRLDAAGSS